MELTLKAKTYLMLFNDSTKSHDLFSLDFRKLYRKLQEFPDFTPDLLTPISPYKEKMKSDLTTHLLKIWIPPVSSLLNEILSTPNILEFDSFFKNALLYVKIEQKCLGFIELFPEDPELSHYHYHCLNRLTKFFNNLKSIKLLLMKQQVEEEMSLYRSCICEICNFSLDLIQMFQSIFHLISQKEANIYKNLICFLQKNLFDESLNLPMASSTLALGDGESNEEIDSKFKESFSLSNISFGMSLPLSYLSSLEKKTENLDSNIDLNISTKFHTKTELELPSAPNIGNTSKRLRTLSRISQKMREKSFYYPNKKNSSVEDFKEDDRITWMTEAEMREKEEKEKIITMNQPVFVNQHSSLIRPISENEKEKLRGLNESNIINSVNYDEVKYEEKYDTKLEKDKIIMGKYSRNDRNNATLLRYQEKLMRLQDDLETTTSSVNLLESIESTTHKENSGNVNNRPSLLMSSIKRNSKKLPSKIVKDSYEQMKEIEKKNQTILKTFKKSKEKSKIRNKKKESVIAIVKINGVSFQEPEECINKHKEAYLTPEFVKDVDEEDVLSSSSSSSDEDKDKISSGEEDKEGNYVLERRKFLHRLYHGSKPRLTLKRHSKILTGREGRLDNEKLKKLTEKKNLFQNWHLTEDMAILKNISAFNVKTSRESVNFFIIRFLISMKLKTHEYTSQLKIIRDRWNKIKFAFQMFMLYRKLHEKRSISFFDEAHIIVKEMKQTSLLHEFDQFLYLMERNINDIIQNNMNESCIDDRSVFERKRARSQSKNIYQVLKQEEIETKVLILERSVKKFTPRKHWNNMKKFMVFDAEISEQKFYEKISPDIVLL